VSRGTQEYWQKRFFIFVYGAVTRSGFAFQQIQLMKDFVTFLAFKKATPASYNPQQHFHGTINYPVKVVLGLGFFPFARRY
jgi:hypothetical protein